MLGADGPGKAEATIGAVAACALFCDEWAQASHGGELTGAVEEGLVDRDRVTDLGAVLAGEAPGPRRAPDAVTLFDSTGLAIQDLAIAAAAVARLARRPREAQTVERWLGLRRGSVLALDRRCARRDAGRSSRSSAASPSCCFLIVCSRTSSQVEAVRPSR